MLPAYITNAEAAKGRKPPRMPTPRWYGSDSEVVRIFDLSCQKADVHQGHNGSES